MESLMLWLMLWKRCHENFYVVVDVVEVVAIVVENGIEYLNVVAVANVVERGVLMFIYVANIVVQNEPWKFPRSHV